MAENSKFDRFESLEFQALDENNQSTFPEIWPTQQLLSKREGMTAAQWGAQYMQNPTIAEGSIVRADRWKKWDKYVKIPGSIDEVEFILPDLKFVIMVMDTAYTNNKRSNPSACCVFGIFDYKDELTGRIANNAILLQSYSKKMEFSELKKQAKIWIKDWKPDCVVIEEKSSGPALRSELKEAGIFAEPVMPKPYEDKVSRLNSVSDVFNSGVIWHVPSADNDACIQQVADFPNGDGDDYVDCVSYAVRRFRRGGLIASVNDAKPSMDLKAPNILPYY
jgi:predicted phage terminase large subunit-like protein